MSGIKAELEAELAEVRGAIEERKRQVKQAAANVLALEAVEAELRSLRTRLGRLENNHRRLVGDVNF